MNLRPTFLVLAAAAGPVNATFPPPDATFETIVCAATHVFVGTAQNFRVTSGNPFGAQANQTHLTLDDEVAVDVSVSRVLHPQGWKPVSPVEFRFGGGLFSVSDLRSDLLGKERIFYTKASGNATSRIHRTSYGWYLGAQATKANLRLALKALSTCAPPNKSLERTQDR